MNLVKTKTYRFILKINSLYRQNSLIMCTKILGDKMRIFFIISFLCFAMTVNFADAKQFSATRIDGNYVVGVETDTSAGTQSVYLYDLNTNQKTIVDSDSNLIPSTYIIGDRDYSTGTCPFTNQIFLDGFNNPDVNQSAGYVAYIKTYQEYTCREGVFLDYGDQDPYDENTVPEEHTYIYIQQGYTYNYISESYKYEIATQNLSLVSANAFYDIPRYRLLSLNYPNEDFIFRMNDSLICGKGYLSTVSADDLICHDFNYGNNIQYTRNDNFVQSFAMAKNRISSVNKDNRNYNTYGLFFDYLTPYIFNIAIPGRNAQTSSFVNSSNTSDIYELEMDCAEQNDGNDCVTIYHEVLSFYYQNSNSVYGDLYIFDHSTGIEFLLENLSRGYGDVSFLTGRNYDGYNVIYVMNGEAQNNRSGNSNVLWRFNSREATRSPLYSTTTEQEHIKHIALHRNIAVFVLGNWYNNNSNAVYKLDINTGVVTQILN